MKKPKVSRSNKAAKEDLQALQTAMNAGTIPKRKPGEEVQAANENGARVAIKSELEKPDGKLKQVEAPALVPPLDGVGKAANLFSSIIKKLAELSEEKGDAESKLIAALKRAKRTSIKVDGYAFFLNHKGPVDKIQVQKPK